MTLAAAMIVCPFVLLVKYGNEENKNYPMNGQ